MFLALSGILAIGNIQFSRTDDDCVQVSTATDLENASALFGVEQEDLKSCLLYLRNQTRGEIVEVNYSESQAEGDAIDFYTTYRVHV